MGLGSILGTVAGNLIAPGIGGQIGGALGGAYDAKQKSGVAAATHAQQMGYADEAYQRTLPWDVSGMFGTATFDEEGRELKLGLSDPWQKEYDIALEGAAKQRDYISGLEGDPYTAGKKFYEQQKALYAPEQEKERLDLEKRLIAQGMFGSTGGALQTQALREAQLARDLEAQYAGLDKAQNLIDLYRARSSEDLGQAEVIGQLPQKYAETGSGIGTGLGSVAESAAGRKTSVASMQGQSRLTDLDRYGSAFSGLFSPIGPSPQQAYGMGYQSVQARNPVRGWSDFMQSQNISGYNNPYL